jgi:hypothetical protein
VLKEVNMRMNKFTWTKKRMLIGVVVICVVAMSGLTVWLNMGRVAEAAVLNPHPGLVGWWRFDEGSGTVAGDSSGNGNNGTIYGATWVAGKYGDALNFSGVNNDVACGNSLTDPVVFTLTAWIKPTAGFSGDQDIIARGPGGNSGGWELKIVGGAIVVGASFSDQWRSLGQSGVIVSGQWQMVTGTWNGTYLSLYVNGVLVAQSTNLSAYTRQLSTSEVWIGSWVGAYNFFGGIIDEVQIYNRALSAAEIQTLYQKNPDFSSKLLAAVPKGTTQFIATLSWQGTGSINVTIQSPSQNYTESMLAEYQKTVYSTSSGTASMLNIKRLSVSINALPSDQNWYIVLTFNNVNAYQITVEVQK